MKQSKKAKVFALFSEGKTPSSAEVKAIGPYKTSRYKYFCEWQRLGNPEAPIRSWQFAKIVAKIVAKAICRNICQTVCREPILAIVLATVLAIEGDLT